MAPNALPSTGQIAETLCLCTFYVFISAALINLNKYLMHPDRFPYSNALTVAHMITTFLCCAVLYLVSPNLFPSMERALAHKDTIARYFPLISVLFILGVVCSNEAYLYCNVAFLQFMKEWNVAMVFFLSCLAGSQVCDRTKFATLVWITVFACVAVTGDLHFSRFGFVIQIMSQLGETSKTVFQEWLLGGSELKLDPLTYLMFMAPIIIVFLCITNAFIWTSAMTHAALASWRPLLGSSLCAFMLNVTIAVILKRAGAMAFILSGLVKDIVIVVSSSFLYKAPLHTQEIVGFALSLAGIGYWGMLKARPDHALVAWLPKLLKCCDGYSSLSKDERVPLVGGSHGKV